MMLNPQVLQALKFLNFPCTHLEQISTGKFNETHIGYLKNPHEGKDRIIIRIAPPEDAGFIFYEFRMMAQEPEVHRIVAEKTNIPIPRIFVYDNSRKILDRDFLIMEWMEGIPLSDAPVSQAVFDSVQQAVGKYLLELHDQCQTTQYGYLGAHHCMEPQFDWISAFQIMWRKLIQDIQNCNVYDQTESQLALQTLDKHRKAFNRNIPASLLHMDIWNQNILIGSDNTVTGILDWDRALWGDPEIEFAVLDYCGFNTQPFCEGYSYQPDKSPEQSIRMAFYHLYEVQKYLVIYTLRRPQPARVQQYKQYAIQLLKKL
jgi:aminoglycoside phosphotransferase (APT) family kinase protein